MMNLTILTKLLILSGSLLVLLVLSSLYLRSQIVSGSDALQTNSQTLQSGSEALQSNSETMKAGNVTLKEDQLLSLRLKLAGQAQKEFSDMKYWLTDLAVSWLIESEKNAEIANKKLADTLKEIDRFAPGTAETNSKLIETIYEKSIEAVDAYIDGNRVLGNSRLADARKSMIVVDMTLAELVDNLHVQAERAKQAAVADAEAALAPAALSVADAGAALRPARQAVARASQASRMSIILIIGAVVLAVGLTSVIVGSITAPIAKLTGIMGQLAEGDNEVEILGSNRGDEIGSMSRAVEVFKDSAIQRIKLKDELQRVNEDLDRKVVERTAELARTVAALRESESRFRAVAETAGDAIISADQDGNIISWNKSAERIFGYSKQEIISQPITRLMPEKFHSEHKAGISKAVALGVLASGGSPMELLAVSKKGTNIPVELSLATWQSKGQRYFTSIARDITERKRADQSLRDALTRAESSSIAKSQFLATMSHELRTPLNAIIGFSEIMKERPADSSSTRYQEFAGHIHLAGEHLLGLLSNVLDFTSVESGRLVIEDREQDVAEIFTECEIFMGGRAGNAAVAMRFEVCDGLPMLWADPMRLKQILLNLISNAIKFTQRDGWVTVTGKVNKEGGIVLAVSDSGVGIAQEDIPRALEKFGQVRGNQNDPHEGVGLGLALAAELMRLHGGSLSIASEVGVGTTVTLVFPPERTATVLEGRTALGSLAPC